MRLVSLSLLSVLLGCSSPGDDPQPLGDGAGDQDGPQGDSGTHNTGDTGDTGGTGGTGLPGSPAPFTVTVSGALEQAITFTESSCSRPNGSNQLRQFWRGRDHVFVLRVEMLNSVEEAGTFTEADGARAALQEEAGGSGSYFTAGPGDAIEMVVESLDDEADEAWGTWSVSGMTDSSGGAITVSPLPLPLWCDSFL